MDTMMVVLKRKLCSLQVCVPKSYTDKQVEAHANALEPTGIESKWKIRREGHPDLCGDPERRECAEESCRCHIVLDC